MYEYLLPDYETSCLVIDRITYCKYIFANNCKKPKFQGQTCLGACQYNADIACTVKRVWTCLSATAKKKLFTCDAVVALETQ